MSRGAIWLSAIIYVLIAITILAIVLEAGLPFIQEINERNAFNKVQDSVVVVDAQIQQVAAEGQGSQRVIPFEVLDGEVSVTDEHLRWKLETEHQLVEPQSRLELGNRVIASDVDVSAQDLEDTFLLQNSRILANISKIGSSTNYSTINTSAILNAITFKESGTATNGTFTFFVNDSASLSGNGYTELQQSGSSLTTATVLAHINNSAMSYDLLLTLDSKADFLRARIENVEFKN